MEPHERVTSAGQNLQIGAAEGSLYYEIHHEEIMGGASAKAAATKTTARRLDPRYWSDQEDRFDIWSTEVSKGACRLRCLIEVE